MFGLQESLLIFCFQVDRHLQEMKILSFKKLKTKKFLTTQVHGLTYHWMQLTFVRKLLINSKVKEQPPTNYSITPGSKISTTKAAQMLIVHR